MITALRAKEIDLAIGLTEGWVSGLLAGDGPKLRGYRIIGQYVQSSLRWAIVTGRNRDDINGVADLANHRKVGVSRLGSGSHIMASVLAQQEGWSVSASAQPSKTLDFVPLGPLADLIKGVSSGDQPAADFFMWEQFTTKPYFDPPDSPLKKIGEIYTPWPSWHIVARDTAYPDPEKDANIETFLTGMDRGIRKFNEDPEDVISMLSEKSGLSFRYSEDDAREWLKSVEYTKTTRGVDKEVLGKVVDTLKGAGVVDAKTEITDGDGVIGIPR